MRTICGFLLGILAFAVLAFAQVRVPGPGGKPASAGGGGGGNWSNINWYNSTTALNSVSVAAGDLIVVVGSSASGTSTSVDYYFCDNASGGSNTYTFILTVDSDRPGVQSIGWAKAKATETINISSWTNAGCTSSASSTIEIMHGGTFRNDAGSNYAVDASNSATGTCSTTVTSTVSNVLLFGFGDASSSHTAGSGFTQLHEGANTMRLLTEYKAGANSPGALTVDKNCGTPRSIAGIAFKIL